jgi:hypothetical protein
MHGALQWSQSDSSSRDAYCPCLGKGTGAAWLHQDPGWLKPPRTHARRGSQQGHLPGGPPKTKPGPQTTPGPPAPTAQDVARRILGEDVTQIEYYTERVKRMVGKVHLQRHHPLRPGRLRPCGRRATERRRARRAAAAVPPAPRCLPRATRRGGGLFAHAEACGFGHMSNHRTPISGSIKVRVLTRAKGRSECCGAGCCLATPASKGPGGGPHRAQEPWRFRRPKQPAGPLLPLQCR